MATRYYIDGYNVIHKSAYLRGLFHGDIELARNAFIDMLAQFCGTTDSSAKIVFDGRGKQATLEKGVRGGVRLEVMYSSGRQDADSVIEREIYTAPNRREMIVVTADRGIRDFCMRLGALVMSPDHFLETVRGVNGDVKQAAELKNTPNMGTVEDRLGAGALEQLKKLREKLGP